MQRELNVVDGRSGAARTRLPPGDSRDKYPRVTVSATQRSAERAIGNDDLDVGVVGQFRRARDDEVGVFPGPVGGDEGQLLGQPPRDAFARRLAGRDARLVALLGRFPVGLNPDSSISQVGELFS